VQFRINGVQLPEGLSVFGQALETRFARGISLLTGALPAQYGRLENVTWMKNNCRKSSEVYGLSASKHSQRMCLKHIA
jgi:hypothetical protein